MKTAAKVFIVLGMIFGFILILPIIFGALSISKINSATQKSELVGLGVCTLLFCSLLGGIFMLCIPESELQPATANSAPTNSATIQNNYITNTKDNTSKSDVENVADSLTKLKNLRDAGTISDEEFERMKKDLLNKI